MCRNARENDASVHHPQSVCGKQYTIYVYEQKGKAMKKITKIISFCAAVTMAATAVPASSLLMAQAADVAKITVGKDAAPIVVNPGDKEVEIPLYMETTRDVEGISFGFVTTGEGKATKELLNANSDTYIVAEPADAFVSLGKWEKNPAGLSWGVPSSGKAVVKASDVSPDEPFISLYYNIPDEKTVTTIAKNNGLDKVNDGDKAYYDFPLDIDRESMNSKDGKLFTWIGPNNTHYEDEAEVSNTVIRVYVTPDDSDVTTTTATTTTTAQTTTTTVATTTDDTKDDTLPQLNVNGGKDLFVEPGQQEAEIPLYIKNPIDTTALSFGFKLDAATVALLDSSNYVTHEASDPFVSLGKWEKNPKGLSWGVASSGKTVVKASDISDNEAIVSLYYNIPDKATVQTIADDNKMELKTGTYNGKTVKYYEFPLQFDRERLNSKLGHIVEWSSATDSHVKANYVGNNLCVVMETVSSDNPEINVNKDEIVIVDAGQKEAEIPLYMKNAEDTVGITVAFKTDAEGKPTQELLNKNSDTYVIAEPADVFVSLGKWENNPKGLSWGVPSNGKTTALASDISEEEAFFSLYYNIPSKKDVESIADANGLKPQKDGEGSTYYDFPLVFEREKLNNKDGKLLDWIGPNDVSIRERAIYQDNILRVYTDRKNITQVDTRVEVSGEETTDASGNTVDSHKIFVEPGQQEAEVPLKVYDAVDATAVSFAFQTDGEGAATQKLLNSEGAYQDGFYAFADALLNLGKPLHNNAELICHKC